MGVIMEHDILRADRKWYMILEQFSRPLPQTFEDRQLMAEYDRPFSETEKEMRQQMIDKQTQLGQERKIAPKRYKNIWYRHPTCGGNRWSARPPRWYPVVFKMRSARLARMTGTPCKGQGNARSQGPWGNLAKLGFGPRA